MADVTNELLKTQLRQLRLPTMGREFEKLARDAASGNQTFAQLIRSAKPINLAFSSSCEPLPVVVPP